MSPSTVQDVGAPESHGSTPARIFCRKAACERIAAVAALRDALARPSLALVSGYSFKTNPRPELLAAARDRGFFAETISPDELRWAAQHGFSREKTIYNGPAPLLEPPHGAHLGVVFADSLEALAHNARRGVTRLDGVRLRPSMLASRFGVPFEDDEALAQAAAAAQPRAPLAVSFHARRSDFKGASWRDVAADVLDRAAELQARAQRPVVAFDVGGGWTPEDFDAHFEPDVRWLMDRVERALPDCARLFFEAGQAVCTPSEALLTTVLEVRERRGRRDAVVDVAYSDWPEMHAYVHGLYAWRDGAWQPLGRGPDRMLGRTCLEYDLIEGLRFPPGVREGDRILITDTGSYDHSMSFSFARGEAAG